MSATWDEETEALRDQALLPAPTLAEAHSQWHQQQAAGHIASHEACPLDCSPSVDGDAEDVEPYAAPLATRDPRSPYAYLAGIDGGRELVRVVDRDHYLWEDPSLSDSLILFVAHANGAESMVERHQLKAASFVVNGLDLDQPAIAAALGHDISSLTHNQQHYLAVLLAPTFDPRGPSVGGSAAAEQLADALQQYDNFGGNPMDADAIADRVQSWRNTILGENWVSFELDRDEDGINGFTMGIFIPDLNMHLTKWNDVSALRPRQPGLLGAIEIAEVISTTYQHVLATAVDSGLIHEVTNGIPASTATSGTEQLRQADTAVDQTRGIPF